jgi:outer membrane murein-binding lipoprotein Lpp
MGTPKWIRAAAALSLLGAAGCVSQETHDQSLAEVRRLRAEAYQRSAEAAALRVMIDRLTVEIRTREPVNMELMRRYDELAASFAQVSRQCAERAERAAPTIQRLPPNPNLPPAPPPARRIDDELFGDRH